MGIFFKNDIIVNRSCHDLLSELSTATIISCDRINYGKKGEFRGSVWQNGFRIALNTYYWNSFESQATGYIQPLGENKCVVHLSIEPHTFVVILMCFFNFGLLVALIAAVISVFPDGTSDDFVSMLLFLPFFVVDVFFLRFALYSNYNKLKKRMLELLG